MSEKRLDQHTKSAVRKRISFVENQLDLKTKQILDLQKRLRKTKGEIEELKSLKSLLIDVRQDMGTE